MTTSVSPLLPRQQPDLVEAAALAAPQTRGPILGRRAVLEDSAAAEALEDMVQLVTVTVQTEAVGLAVGRQYYKARLAMAAAAPAWVARSSITTAPLPL